MAPVFGTFVVLLQLVAAAEVPSGGGTTSEELEAKLHEVTVEFERYKSQSAKDLELYKAESAKDFALYRAESAKDFARLEALVGGQGGALSDAQPAQPAHPRRASARRTSARRTSAAASIADLQGAMDHMWLIICGALVMFMQAGFALLEAGCCRAKNVQNILMKNMTDVCAGTLCWWAFGWMFAYGPVEGKTTFAGNTQYFGHDFMQEPIAGLIVSSSAPRDWFFQWAFCSAAATIVSGGIAERVNFPGYFIYTLFITTIIYPVVVAWTWSGSGWLQGGTEQHINEVGYYDFAGSGIVHMCGGVAALTASVIVGPRTGRFDKARESEFDPHSLPLIVLGTFILWFGWYGFNCGSTLGLSTTAAGQLAASVAMNTTISAATGGLTVLGLRLAINKKYDVSGMCNGILAGLVSITAPCGNVESGSAFIIGLVGALIYQGASSLLRMAHIDDAVDAFPVHGAAGVWGTLAAAIFDWGDGIGIFHGWGGFSCTTDSSGGCMDGARGQAFFANVIGVAVIAAWTSLLSAAVLIPLKKMNILRADDDLQEKGMDKKHSPPKAYTIHPEKPEAWEA